jgi:hypothetical protein
MNRGERFEAVLERLKLALRVHTDTAIAAAFAVSLVTTHLVVRLLI